MPRVVVAVWGQSREWALARGVGRLTVLAEAGRALAVVPDSDRLVEVAAEWALRALASDTASISVLDHAHGCLQTIINAGALADWEQRRPVDERYPVADYPLATRLLEEGRAWQGSVDDPTTPPEERELLEALGKRGAMAVSLYLGDTVWGELYVTRAADPFDAGDVAIAEAYAGVVGAALSHLAARDALRTMAYLDPLTGLGNRRIVDERLEAVFAGPELARSVALVVVDVDDLKLVNDHFGHAVGDRVLREVGALLSAEAGRLPHGLAARIGGDEFCLVTEGADREDVVAAIGRLDAGAESIEPCAGLSCGWAMAASRLGDAPTPAAAARALLRLADAAQYRAKRRGRPAAGRALEERRRARVGDGARAVDLALARLEGVEGSLERLTVVATAVAEALDAAAWGVSCRTGDGPVTTVRSGYARVGEIDADMARSSVGVEFDVARYPATGAALEGGSFWATLCEGERAEREFLAAHGFAELLAAGTRAGRDCWLVELGGDALGLPLAPHEGILRALVEIAVHATATRERPVLATGLSGRSEGP